MFPLISSLITGGAGLLGSMFSSNSTAETNQQNIQAQMATNASNQAFTERMSNTAYQRSAADMKAAGLNPIAMFSSGSGGPASSPQGSQVAPKAEAPGKAFENLGHTASAAIKSAVDATTQEKMVEEIANTVTARKKMEAETSAIKEGTHLTEQKSLLTIEEIRALQHRMPGYELEGMSNRELIGLAKKYPETFKDVLGANWVSSKTRAVTDQLGSAVGSATGMKRAIDAGAPKRTTTQKSGVSTNTKGEKSTWDEFYDVTHGADRSLR